MCTLLEFEILPKFTLSKLSVPSIYTVVLCAGSQTLKNITAEEFKILEDFKNEHIQNNPEDHGMPVEEFVEFMKENEAVKNIVLKLADTK